MWTFALTWERKNSPTREKMRGYGSITYPAALETIQKEPLDALSVSGGPRVQLIRRAQNNTGEFVTNGCATEQPALQAERGKHFGIGQIAME
jgi:hypothetical protein